MTDHVELIAESLFRSRLGPRFACEAWARQLRTTLADAGLMIVSREPDDEMAARGAVAVLDEGAPDFAGNKGCVTMSARLSAKEAKRVFRAMLPDAGGDDD